MDGAYDGDVSFEELRKHGDFGLGTLDAVDGDMIALDGRFYRAATDGTVGEIRDSARTPFAVVTFFEPDATMALKAGVYVPPSDALVTESVRLAA